MTRESWPYYPVFQRLDGQPVLVVGGGEVARRKVDLLRRAGARVQLVAHELHPELRAALADGRLEHLATEFEPAQLRGMRLAIAATDDVALNQAVSAAADAAGVPVNVVDNAALSSFVTPAIVDRAPILVAISTAGTAPVLARRLREQIERLLPAGLPHLAHFMARWRDRVRAAVPAASRRRVWERFLDGGGAESLLAGDEAEAARRMQALLADDRPSGEVYLVGAGPGDPDLLTLRALRLMQQADVVLHDRLVDPQILDRVRRDAERIDVGKRRDRHTLPQEQINAELVRLAREGKRVLRLKGGDPFVFGRGGEEIETLTAEGIPFQVVPGITAANGCAAYAGIPLTHRDYAQACVFVTGHPRKDGTLELPWPQLARPGQTVVIYMGLTALAALCERLIEAGLPEDWPAAVVENGTRASQRVVTGTLSTLADAVHAGGVHGPSLVIVGEVVRLRRSLAWFGREHGRDVKDA